MAAQTRRVLSRPTLVKRIIVRNVKTASRLRPAGAVLAVSRRRSSI
jgi:hypothetical protein